MTTKQFFISSWEWNPGLLVLSLAVLVVGVFLLRPPHRWRILFLIGAVMVYLVARISPIDVLANGYLFSAHMLQHLLLLLVVPLFFLLFSSPLVVVKSTRSGFFVAMLRPLNWPVLTWLCGVGAMWLWHAPALCNAAQQLPAFRRFQTFTLLAMGMAFWLPIVGPVMGRRLKPLAGIIYLFTACLACTILGIIITFSPVSVCSVYAHPVDRLGILPMIYGDWGLTPDKDQQLGGLLMWVPACFIYLGGIILLLCRWYRYDGSNETAVENEPAFQEKRP